MNNNKKQVQRKGRTLAVSVDSLLESPRFKIAMDVFEEDPMLMRAILIELGMEAQNVAKYTIISEAMKMYSLPRYELKPYLSSINDFTRYNIWWGMSEVEQRYYSMNPKGELTKKEARELLKKIKKDLGMK